MSLIKINDMIIELQENVTSSHMQLLQINKNIIKLSEEMENLHNYMDPLFIIDDSTTNIIMGTISAFTVCNVVCQIGLYCYGYKEDKRNRKVLPS